MINNYNDYSLRYLLFDHQDAEIGITRLDWSGDLKLRVTQRNKKGEMLGHELGVPEDLAICVCDEHGNFHWTLFGDFHRSLTLTIFTETLLIFRMLH